MSEHRATIQWRNAGETLDYARFSRDHQWSFKGGRLTVPASSAPAYQGSDAAVDPEDALVAALSSCHMLTFLAIAARRRLVVAAYSDQAVGHLETDAEGRTALTRVELHPEVRWAAGTVLTPEELQRLHAKAHAHCFIANSVKTAVTIHPALP
jgi:organic hydroperoxide reductase OsmC/OhrA